MAALRQKLGRLGLLWAGHGGQRGLSSSRQGAGEVFKVEPAKIRDFAIVAHVDHGKTTLMDRLLSHCGQVLDGDRSMDSNAMEKERGITITSKYTSMMFREHLINAVDTPGHADFGGEVERVMGMVDGCVLLVDAVEGPQMQTRYVLNKALQRGFKPIVVLNKVDRDECTTQRCGDTASTVFDLFASLGATDDQLDFPLLYASARQGWASSVLPAPGSKPPQANMEELLEVIVRHVPPPRAAAEAPFSLCVAMVERDNFLGRIVTGRVDSGSVRVGHPIKVLHQGDRAGQVSDKLAVTRIIKRSGMQRVYIDQALPGDVVSLAGALTASIADTVGAPGLAAALNPGRIDPPTLSMVFSGNDSPLAGKAGKAVPSRVIGERLMAEAETSVSLKVLPVEGNERYEVQARGELQMGVLVETLRREGLEMQLSAPQVVLRREGQAVLEPLEEVVLEVDAALSGAVIEGMVARKGEMSDMVTLEGGARQRLSFLVPSRGMIGYRAVFTQLTAGQGTMQRAFSAYGEHRGPLGDTRKGVIVNLAPGTVTAYAVEDLASRGTFFVKPGTEVYAGMVVGECNKAGMDLEVNMTKEKSSAEVYQRPIPPRLMSLEDMLGFMAQDELLEVTPGAVRLRKAILDSGLRKRKQKQEESMGLA